MKGRRWRDQEDALLKQKVLESIRNGETQLTAFAEIGKKIGRTPGACGFRWNAVLRQQDPSSYKDAKKKRVYNKLREKKEAPVQSLLQAIAGLQQLASTREEIQQKIKRLEQRLIETKEKYDQLRMERTEMNEQRTTFSNYKDEIKAKYQDLLHLFQQIERQQGHRLKENELNRDRKQTIVDTDLKSFT